LTHGTDSAPYFSALPAQQTCFAVPLRLHRQLQDILWTVSNTGLACIQSQHIRLLLNLTPPDLLLCDPTKSLYDSKYHSCFQQGCGRTMQTHGQGPAGSGPRAGAWASAPPANGPSWGQMLTPPLASGPRLRSPGSKQPMVSAASTYPLICTPSHTSFTVVHDTFVSPLCTPVSPFLQLLKPLLVSDLLALATCW